MFHLAQETEQDWWEVEALYDLCFAPGREALSSYRLRDGVDRVAELSLLARDDDAILAGAIRFWPVKVGNHCVAAGAGGCSPDAAGGRSGWLSDPRKPCCGETPWMATGYPCRRRAILLAIWV